ncbi:hypothetical protein Misp01_51380 [Microtetraspora sp. NBRC 13810]|nr:hypothetical protein Misp01_51380 [Microtetraspora sp. NBRC 13810]
MKYDRRSDRIARVLGCAGLVMGLARSAASRASGMSGDVPRPLSLRGGAFDRFAARSARLRAGAFGRFAARPARLRGSAFDRFAAGATSARRGAFDRFAGPPARFRGGRFRRGRASVFAGRRGMTGGRMPTGRRGMTARGMTGRGMTGRGRIAAMAGVAMAGVAVAGVARRSKKSGKRLMNLHAAVTINRPRQEVYRYWRDLGNLPRFMAHLEAVETAGDTYSHWTARGPLGPVEWDAEIVEDRSGEQIAWRSIEGSAIRNSGLVRFSDAPGGRGTELRVDIEYAPPGRRFGSVVAKLLGEHPEQQIRDDLRRFKQIMETGEIVVSDGSPEGVRALRQARQRPAQPVR